MEGNIRPDFAKLPEDSEIYQPADSRSTREKLKAMNAKEKAAFIAEYYGISILVTVALVAAAIFLVVHFLFSKDIGFNVMAVNTGEVDCPADSEEFYKDFLDSQNFDWKHEEVSVNVGLGVSMDAEDSASQTNLQMIVSRLMTGSVDVFFANEDVLYSIGEFEYLADLNNYLPADILDKYEDDLVYIKGVESGKTYPVGIRIPADNEWLQKSGWYEDGAVVGIQDNAEHGELATNFVLEILGENEGE
ncbi:MAG: hypothetical protein PUF65_07470 [Lachnospiraceae bacterium]|nr:hypothetical protein [Lachnospiraceae bacterium]